MVTAVISNVTDQYRRSRAANAERVMMLCQPEPFVAPAFGFPGQIEAVIEGLGRRNAAGNYGQFEQRIRDVFCIYFHDIFEILKGNADDL